MSLKRLNWSLWFGLLLSLFAFLSYFFIFVWMPATRDFPWANLLLFIPAIVFLVLGFRHGLEKDRPRRSRIAAFVISSLGMVVFGLFVFTFFVAGKWLPASQGAPHVGQKAPDFTLPNTNNSEVSLSQLLTTPINGQAPRGVLLIFYRGYW